MRARVLLVDDDRSMSGVVRGGLTRRGFDVHTASSIGEAQDALGAEQFECVVTDVRIGAEDGIELCRQIKADRPDLPVIVITAFGSLETAIGAIRSGAYDFITKPFEIEALEVALNRAVEHRALRVEVGRLRREIAERADNERLLIGDSPPMRRLEEMLPQVAGSEASVLISGETGTGKEVVARAIHQLSPRSNGPFVAVNCAALPEQLLESELFGHVEGAFTDARRDRKGLIVEADGGVLFLDEIGDMPISVQPKLLRALQERSVRPIGGNEERSVDIRVICASHRDLEEAMEAGRFREDLYYRLNVIPLELSPLRARGNDVIRLAHHFLEDARARAKKEEISGFTEGAIEKLLGYQWPGNVRELVNCVERAVALTTYDKITVDDLPEKVRAAAPAALAGRDDPSAFVSLAVVEERYIDRVLNAVGGNKAEAARILGLDRTTLYRKLSRRKKPKAPS